MRVKTGDFLMALVLLVMSGVLYMQSGKIDTTMIYAMGPVFFPKILIFCLGGLSLLLMFQSVDLTGRKNWCASSCTIALHTVLLRWLLVALVLLYLFVLPVFGYVWATMPFLFAGMCLLGPRKARNLVIYGIVAVGVTLGLQYIFAGLLKLFLP